MRGNLKRAGEIFSTVTFLKSVGSTNQNALECTFCLTLTLKSAQARGDMPKSLLSVAGKYKKITNFGS